MQFKRKGRGMPPLRIEQRVLFYDNWLIGENNDLRALPGDFPCLLLSDEGVGSAVDCAPQGKKVNNIRSGVRIPLEQWSSPMD
ncbi:hypothetical protein L484_013197 [Morus notabilis]|uniref:Uncharacterized protein n=1 Tax=Morus notabilis TaxID=981085 RepID=W9RME0_9ROSA|nr:hypothetical protein L484_013197 [Morus notabilis]